VNITPTSERQALERIARKYEKEGYKVQISPSPSELPEQLKTFEIDLMARRGDETVIVEVKSARSEKMPVEIARLAELVNSIPHHRFDFVAVQRESTLGRDEWLDPIALRTRIEEADQVFQRGQFEASIMLLWSATEGILRLLAGREHLTLSSRGPQTMVKTLYSQGILDKGQYEVLEQAGRLRNLAVHGFKVQPVDDHVFQLWRHTIASLLLRT
jgi:uncharacterized protein YutE (UPF0331/DUF86 family)